MSEVEQEFTRGQRVTAFIVLCLCFVIVGGSAFWVSYEHIRFVALLKHQPPHLAWVYPLTVDGMLGIGAVGMWQDSVRGMVARPWARIVFWLGLGVSIAANVIWYVAVWGVDLVGVAVAAWPAAAMLFSVEVVTNPSRRRKVLKATARAAAEAEQLLRSVVSRPAVATPQPPIPAPADGQTDAGPGATSATGDEASSTQPAPVSPSERAATRTPRTGRPEDTEPLPPELVALALQVGGAWRERTGREVTRDGLRAGLRDAGWQRGISNVTAGRLLDLIRNDTDGQAGNNEDQAERAAVVAANGR